MRLRLISKASQLFISLAAVSIGGPFSFAQQPEVSSSTPQPEAKKTYSISPDKKWEYKLVDESKPSIVRTGTNEVLLDLSQFPHPAESSEVVWAPDSRRFAFNFQSGTRYQTTDLYQSDGQKWQELDDPESDEIKAQIHRAMIADKKKLKISADKRGRPILTAYQIRKWIDPNTALLYASSEETFEIKNEMQSVGASFFFTLKFDSEGNWKIVRTCAVRKKGIGNLNKLEQEELKRIEKEQSEETSTIGDRIYHHQP